MTEAQSISAKYMFLDIVNYSSRRSIEAQTEIISTLNDLVRESVGQFNLTDDQLIYLPTGDGICVALLGVESPYDMIVSLPLALLAKLDSYNQKTTDEMRRFQIRIGLNANVDNMVTDINGKRNVAGAGINLAQRIMNAGDGNQILVGDSVFETLHYREKYMRSFKTFSATAKHGHKLTVHQLLEPSVGLDTSTPSRFREIDEPKRRLSDLAAYYFAHAVKNRPFLRATLRNRTAGSHALVVLLYMLAYDSMETFSASDIDPHVPHTWGAGQKTIEEQFAHYDSLDFWITCDLSDSIYREHLAEFSEYFEPEFYPNDRLFINKEGQEKLRRDWPRIWQEFGLNSPQKAVTQ